MANWEKKRVLVTGGCSFIGSHLVDALVQRGAIVRVVDDLSSGLVENIAGHLDGAQVQFIKSNLLDPGVAARAVKDIDVVFHLAATHGGRGYIDLHQAACATNLALDGIVIRAAQQAGVEQFTYASSGCVYPTAIQADPREVLYLTDPAKVMSMYGFTSMEENTDIWTCTPGSIAETKRGNELYDRRKDPFQLNNLIDDNAGTAEELFQRMRDFMAGLRAS